MGGWSLRVLCNEVHFKWEKNLSTSVCRCFLIFELQMAVTHKAVRPGARPHVPPVMAEGDFRLMTPLYDNLQ